MDPGIVHRKLNRTDYETWSTMSKTLKPVGLFSLAFAADLRPVPISPAAPRNDARKHRAGAGAEGEEGVAAVVSEQPPCVEEVMKSLKRPDKLGAGVRK